jgi:lipopolysaccharide export system permease protein
MSSIFVIFMVAAQAMRDRILTPEDILHIIPYIIPSTLPFTVPVSLLFSVTVVYGRLAGDNEIIAVKASGQSAMLVLWPTILFAGGISASLFFLTQTWIPDCAYQAKLVVFRDFEETFYKYLKANREFKPVDRTPFFIKVREVEGKEMIDALIKHAKPGSEKAGVYDTIIQAERASVRFDEKNKVVRFFLTNGIVQRIDPDPSTMIVTKTQEFTFPLADNRQFRMLDKKIQEFTNDEITTELAKFRKMIGQSRMEQAVQAGLMMGSGRVDKVNWSGVQDAYRNYSHWLNECLKFETEREFRRALSFGSLLFVILGAPVGILFARRDFLSAFISCFLPIIMIYYPLILLGQNMGKDGSLTPMISLWLGNALLATLSIFVLPPILRH